MAAVAGGLAAAVIWSIGTAFASRAARRLGTLPTLAWVMLIGLVALAAALPWAGTARLSGHAVVWLALGGAGNVVGLVMLYTALRAGQMGVVMPIVSTEGGVAAGLSIIAGQPVGLIRGLALLTTVLGVVMTAIVPRPAVGGGNRPALARGEQPASARPGDRRAAGLAALTAASMGVSIFATGRAAAVVPAVWAVMPPRLLGVAAVTAPLALRGRLRWPAGSAHLLLVAGLCEVGGFLAFAVAARHGLAVAAVMAALTGALGAGVGRLQFGERLRLTQLVGIAVIFAGVATLTALDA